MAIVEIVQSLEDDFSKGRTFALLSRIRQTEEMYYRALYVLFIAKPEELPHVFSGETPNGFTDIYRAVNEALLDGRGALEAPQTGLSGAAFTTMQLLNNSAHASFPFFFTCIGVVRAPESRQAMGTKLIAHLKMYCHYLNYMEQMFAAGKKKEDVMVGVRNIHKPASAWRT